MRAAFSTLAILFLLAAAGYQHWQLERLRSQVEGLQRQVGRVSARAAEAEATRHVEQALAELRLNRRQRAREELEAASRLLSQAPESSSGRKQTLDLLGQAQKLVGAGAKEAAAAVKRVWDRVRGEEAG